MRFGFGYRGIATRRALRPIVRLVRARGLRPEDVLLASYIKSGVTWLRFMLADVILAGDPSWERVNATIPDVGGQASAPSVLPGGGRLAFTHDRWSGPVRRVVLLVRDARDVVLSEHRWVNRTRRVDLDRYVDAFTAGRSHVFGSWSDHARYWLGSPLASSGNLLVVRFEDLRASPRTTLGVVTSFVGLAANTADLERAVADNDLRRMRVKEDAAVEASVLRPTKIAEPFVGRGSVEAWRSRLTSEQVEAVERAFGPELLRLGYRVGPTPPSEGRLAAG